MEGERDVVELVWPLHWCLRCFDSYGSPTARCAILFEEGPSTMRRTIDGYLEQGDLHLGDRDVFNVQIDGKFLATDSVKSWYRTPTKSGLSYPEGTSYRMASGVTRYCGVTFQFSRLEEGEVYFVEHSRINSWHYYYSIIVKEKGPDFVRIGFSTTNRPDRPDKWAFTGNIYINRTNKPGDMVDLGSNVEGLTRYFGPYANRMSAYEANNLTDLMAMEDPVPVHWGDVDMDAVQGTRAININTLMYAKELFEIGKMVKSTAESLLEKDPRNFVKQASNLYLSYHYGYRLSIQDTKTLYSAARQELRKESRTLAASRARRQWSFELPEYSFLGAGATVLRTRSTKVWYSQMPHELGRLINGLFRWDIFPELGNVYDLIPYSFVVDWFLPIGDILDKIDNHTYASTLDVKGVIRSDKYEVELAGDSPIVRAYFGDVQSLGPVKLTSYRRFFTRELTYPPLQLTPQLGPKNWLPAAALILQRR